MRYVTKRLLHAVLLLFVISFLSFLFLEAAPGNFLDELRLNPRISAETVSSLKAKYGLDRPLPTRYFNWLASAFRGEFGFSFAYGTAVWPLIWPRAKNTLLLTTISTALAWILALPIGVAAAATRRKVLSSTIRGAMATFVSVPDMLVALALLMFAVHTGVAPIGGMSGDQLIERLRHLALPVAALVVISLPVLARHVHAAVSEAMTLPFIQAARAHGIGRSRLLLAYVLPAAANPLISLLGLSIGGLLSSSVLVEVIIGWPGLGPLILEAILSRDVNIVIAATVLGAAFLVIGNLIADILLYATDPRMRRQ